MNSASVDLARGLDSVLADLLPMETLLDQARASALPEDVLGALEDLGLSGLLVDESAGGLGLGLQDLALIGWVGGRRLMPTLSRYSLSLLGPVLADPGAGVGDGSLDTSGWACGWESGHEAADGLSTAILWGRKDAHHALVVGDNTASVIPLNSTVVINQLSGIDPAQGRAVVEYSSAEATMLPSKRAEFALTCAAIGAIAELSGIVDRVNDVTVEYASQREQFGKPLASFQAIQHHLADMRANGELIRSATSRSVMVGNSDLGLLRSLRAIAAEKARFVCETAIQVHGGIGFTWEYGLHLYYRRCLAIQSELGGSKHASRAVGRSAVERSVV